MPNVVANPPWLRPNPVGTQAAVAVLTRNRSPSWKTMYAMPLRSTPIENGCDTLGHAMVPMSLNVAVGGLKL